MKKTDLCKFILILSLVSGCGVKLEFGLMPEASLFFQNTSGINQHVDILWVIDNSGSMKNSQSALAANMNRFLEAFLARHLDFQMAVTTTDAYLAEFQADQRISMFRDGNPTDGPTGSPIVNSLTSNLTEVFLKNILQGTAGSGDERPFQSFRAALKNPSNVGFPRPHSFFSVIILTDEDDFSHDQADAINADYSDPRLHSIQTYTDFLDTLSEAHDGQIHYNVSGIIVPDEACRDFLIQTGGGQKISKRVMELVDATGGIKGSLCNDFGDTLAQISGKILELIHQFKLSRTPRPGTLSVTVNGVLIPESSTQGWTYDAPTNSVTFHGNSVPQEGAEVLVQFIPFEAK